ncbi:hypothetical protein KCU93_g69, partial [Aureobasidium melanogenum]
MHNNCATVRLRMVTSIQRCWLDSGMIVAEPLPASDRRISCWVLHEGARSRLGDATTRRDIGWRWGTTTADPGSRSASRVRYGITRPHHSVLGAVSVRLQLLQFSGTRRSKIDGSFVSERKHIVCFLSRDQDSLWRPPSLHNHCAFL